MASRSMDHWLTMPEAYPGLPAKSRADRALLLIRRPALAISSAYALFIEGNVGTLRRVQIDRGPAFLGGRSFGADALIEANEARRQTELVQQRRPLGPDTFPVVIDGPDRFEIETDGTISAFADCEEFAAESALLTEMMVTFDRMLPMSSLDLRATRR